MAERDEVSINLAKYEYIPEVPACCTTNPRKLNCEMGPLEVDYSLKYPQLVKRKVEIYKQVLHTVPKFEIKAEKSCVDPNLIECLDVPQLPDCPMSLSTVEEPAKKPSRFWSGLWWFNFGLGSLLLGNVLVTKGCEFIKQSKLDSIVEEYPTKNEMLFMNTINALAQDLKNIEGKKMEVWIGKAINLKQVRNRIEESFETTATTEAEKLNFDCYKKEGVNGYNLCVDRSDPNEIKIILKDLPDSIVTADGYALKSILLRGKKDKNGIVVSVELIPLVMIDQGDTLYAKPLKGFSERDPKILKYFQERVANFEQALNEKQNTSYKAWLKDRAKKENAVRKAANNPEFADKLRRGTVILTTLKENNKNGIPQCTGAKIKTDAILTARHCVSYDKRSPAVMLGVYNLVNSPNKTVRGLTSELKVWDDRRTDVKYAIGIDSTQDTSVVVFSKPIFKQDDILPIVKEYVSETDISILPRLVHHRWQIQAGSFIDYDPFKLLGHYDFGIEGGVSGSAIYNTNGDINAVAVIRINNLGDEEDNTSMGYFINKQQIDALYNEAKGELGN